MEIKELNQYRYVVKETVIEDVINETLTPNRIIMIGVKDSTNGIVIPHPIPSDFIRLKYEYQGNSFNTQKSAAEVICRFLNFIHNKITNKDEEFLSFSYYGISGLTLQHGSRFITSLTLQGRNKQTVAIYEQYLIQFYVFLQEQKLIDMQFDFSLFSRSKGYRNRPDSPFRHPSLETRYPSRFTSKKQKQKAKDFRGKDRKMLVTEFIQCSKEIAPEITLGICLQIFGGIRRGEIVNLTRGSFNVVKGKSMIVKIEDNRNILFGHLKNTEKEFPKRLNYLETHMALQTILDNDLLWEVYDLHFEKLIEDAKKKINKVIRPTQYASSWLYVLVHLNNAWRHSDVVNFPRIEFKDTCIKSLTWIEENEISIDDAKNIVYQVMRKDLTVSKTGATANFFCSDDLTISLATAAAICEFITRECAPFSESIIDFGVKHNKFTAYAHKNFFGEFETDFRFESLKMNRSILSYLYVLLEQQGKGAAALEIVQRLRAHYNYSSTEIYIVIPRDQLDFLTQQLFARQNFGYIVDLLAEILYSDNLDNLEQRTNDIITIKKKLGSVYNIEATAGFLNAIQAERKMVVDLLLSKGQDETLDFLFKINAGLLPSKQDNVQCILSESGCIKPQQKECHNCSFSVPNFYSLSALTLSIQSTLEQFNVSFHNTNLPAEKTRLVNLLYKKMDLLVDSCKKFGESEVFKFFEGEKEGYFKLLENLGELSEEVEEYLTYK